MWLPIGQTNPSILETIDPEQDVRLRLIVAVLILLFCIALVLIVAVVIKNRSQLNKADLSKPPSKTPFQFPPPSPPTTSEKSIPEKVSSEASASSQARQTKPHALQFPSTSIIERREVASLNPAASDKGQKPMMSSSGPSSAFLKNSFDLKAYKEELAGMDPEKKRQEILKRLEEINRDKRAAGHDAKQLPKITPGPPSRVAAHTPPISPSQQAIPNSEEGPLPTRPEKALAKAIPHPSLSKQSVSTEESASSQAERVGEMAQSPRNLPEISVSEKTGTPAGLQTDYEKQTETKQDDFSYLSSIERRLNRSSFRKSFKEWMEEAERKEQPPAASDTF
ncbi:MAG: hypothetical protein NZM65_05160 [Flavobacteriales bacterium]|nr:hypothetical protein [Flavobacteriales bacterium]MDW8410061.1 hypothetical protein [Flavobacteriales bacterium]